MVTYKPIPEFPGYEAGDDGSVWSLKRGGRRRLSTRADEDGYLRAEVWVNGRRRNVGVHVLVLLAFVGPRPAGMEAAHEDGDPRNNQPGNLRWKTPKANQGDRVRHGTHSRGERHGCSKLREADVLALRAGTGETYQQAADRLGVAHGTVWSAIKGNTWRHLAAGA